MFLRLLEKIYGNIFNMKYTLCNDHECPKKLKCLRHTDIENLDKKLFFNNQPFDYAINHCDYFIDIKSIKFIKDDDNSNSL
jgi:hypothetical protein